MKKRDLFIQILIFILWIVIVLITGINHEPWADEAQSWLIARDNSYIDMIKNALRYEGHPILWYFILRTLYLIHFPYDFLYIISLSLSGLGIFLLLFKTNLPMVIKIFFPFTFFVLYQDTVIARSYSLLLPILMSIVVFYNSRLEKSVIYISLLILLLCSDTYSFVLSAVLFLFYIYDIFCSKQIDKTKIFSIICYILIAVSTIFYLQIPDDYSLALPSFNFSLKNLFIIFTNGYFDIFTEKIDWIKFSLPFVLYLLAAFIFCKNLRQILFFISLNLSIVTTLSMVISRYWHFGYIIVTLIFTISILCKENNIVLKNNIINTTFGIIFISLTLIQIKWSITAINYDIKNNYSASKELYKFIKTNNLEKCKIHGLGYSFITLQPYFEHNIFDNYETSYYKFSKSFEKKLFLEGQTYAPVIILDPSFYEYYKNYIQTLKDYNVHAFYGSVRTKSTIKPTIDLFVFVNRDKCND